MTSPPLSLETLAKSSSEVISVIPFLIAASAIAASYMLLDLLQFFLSSVLLNRVHKSPIPATEESIRVTSGIKQGKVSFGATSLNYVKQAV